MYVIIESGGSQFKVQQGDIISLPKVKGDGGDKISFPKVLFFKDGDKIEVGSPYLKNVKVEGEIVRSFRGKKVVSFIYKRRKNYERKKGFRRELTEVKITKIAEE